MKKDRINFVATRSGSTDGLLLITGSRMIQNASYDVFRSSPPYVEIQVTCTGIIYFKTNAVPVKTNGIPWSIHLKSKSSIGGLLPQGG